MSVRRLQTELQRSSTYDHRIAQATGRYVSAKERRILLQMQARIDKGDATLAPKAPSPRQILADEVTRGDDVRDWTLRGFHELADNLRERPLLNGLALVAFALFLPILVVIVALTTLED